MCIQGPNVTKGYLNRPEANEEAFAGTGLPLFLKHLHNVETRFYCIQTCLSLDFQSRISVSKLKQTFQDWNELLIVLVCAIVCISRHCCHMSVSTLCSMYVKAGSLDSSHGDLVVIAEQTSSKVATIESAALQSRPTCWQVCQHHVSGITC